MKTCNQVKYLGQVITDTLTDDENIFRQCLTLYVPANVRGLKFGPCSEEVKLTSFKAYCIAPPEGFSHTDPLCGSTGGKQQDSPGPISTSWSLTFAS